MFSKKPAQQPQKPAGNRSMGNATFSVLGEGLSIKGDIAASADLHVDGQVEGDITCTAIVQGERSEITGAVTAQNAQLAGTIRGSITAKELTILATARIHGDVHYETLSIEQGAKVEGRFAARSGAVMTDQAGNPGEPRLTLASSAS